MIFHNPAGAPELACDACGCRWFDRMTNNCYECGTPMDEQCQADYRKALAQFAAARPDLPSRAPAKVQDQPPAGRSALTPSW